ncbi:MAG: hypothetical protein AB1454_02060 [Candidatus Auribacterota bacterium]
MSIDFKLRDFFYPLPILTLRRFMEKSQYFPEDQLRDYQLERLQLIVRHAYNNVPYYRDLWNKLKISPDDIRSLDDLQYFPVLTKDDMRAHSRNMTADNAKKYHPIAYSTSGSTGQPVRFYLDASSNILEFCYYWRHWSWGGYRLGDTFADFRGHFFTKNKDTANDLFHYNRLTRRLVLNNNLISYNNMGLFADCIRKYRPKFLKGLASTIYIFALLLKKRGITDISFQGIFSTGEMLLPHHRKLIEEVMHCKVYDSYGHMERTAAVSECERGGYHINMEYGILELEEKSSSGGTVSGNVIGTSLHNFAMPFIRYRLGDVIEISSDKRTCPCGRTLPLINKLHGRMEDNIVTPDGRVLTSIFIVFEFVDGIELGQLAQKTVDELIVRIAKNEKYTAEQEAKLLGILRTYVGNEMQVTFDYSNVEAIRGDTHRKFKIVVSDVDV